MESSLADWVPGVVPDDVTELIVVRHGETTWNAARRLQGQLESELNEVGVRQAHAAAERLADGSMPFSVVLSSDLQRAFRTAEIIAVRANLCVGGKASVVTCEGLRERRLGVLQGLTIPEARVQQAEAYKAFTSRNPAEPIPGGGESRDQFFQRTKETLESIAQNHRGQRVLVVCHGGVLTSFYHHAKGKSPPGKIVNASINVFSISESSRDWRVLLWNEREHLNDVGVTEGAFGGGPFSA